MGAAALRELRRALPRLWRVLRAASFDDAYERYCAHQRTHHPRAPLPDRRAFCAEALRRKWSGGVNRCC